MDIEKLIEDLQWWAEHCDRTNYGCATRAILSDAATALSTLQAEKEKLRAELEYEKEHANAYYEECGQWEVENEKLRAELEQVKVERDAYQVYFEDLSSKPDCNTCEKKNCEYRPNVGGTIRASCPLYIGPHKED